MSTENRNPPFFLCVLKDPELRVCVDELDRKPIDVKTLEIAI